MDAAEDHRGQWALRRVGSNGVVSVDNQIFSRRQRFKGQLVGVFVDETTIHDREVNVVAHLWADHVVQDRTGVVVVRDGE